MGKRKLLHFTVSPVFYLFLEVIARCLTLHLYSDTPVPIGSRIRSQNLRAPVDGIPPESRTSHDRQTSSGLVA